MSYMSSQFDPKRHSIYIPKNKEKYTGNDNPICRSSWETVLCRYLDNNSNVLEWSSENIEIPYMFQGKKHRYFPDFYAKILNSTGTLEKWVIEVKPYKETHPPLKRGKKSHKTLLHEKVTWEKNKAKWVSAKRFCKKMGYMFKIITEKELFGK